MVRRHADGRGYVRVSEETADLIEGEVDLSEWDDEELYRGRSRAKDGSFRGRQPTLVSTALYQEFIRRQLQRAEQGLIDNMAAAVEVIATIAKDENVEESIRLKAAEMILDRTQGKPKNRIELSALPNPKDSYQQVIESVTVDRSLPAGDDEEDEGGGDVVDAEVVNDPEPEPSPGSDAEDWTPTYGNEEEDDEFSFD